MQSLEEIIQARATPIGRDTDIDADDLIAQRRRFENQRYKEDTSHRKWLAVWTAIVVTCWLGAVLYILIMNDRLICLSDTVLTSLLATTTLNVLGLSFIVLRGHFLLPGK
ncbi:MAG: hypothetical protein M3142_10465 [Bacteroidota bacterium]|nr:hypothetical protein [Bacteroidota bacterium]